MLGAATGPDPQPAGLIRVLTGRWTLPFVIQLSNGGRRYQDLYDHVDGISYKVLTETLRRAERDGLVGRHLDGERIETARLYELTDLGCSLDAPLAAVAKWVPRNWPAVEAARSRWDRLRRGERLRARVRSAHRGTGSHPGERPRSLSVHVPISSGGVSHLRADLAFGDIGVVHVRLSPALLQEFHSGRPTP